MVNHKTNSTGNPGEIDQITRLPLGSIGDTVLKVGALGVIMICFLGFLFYARIDVINLFQGLREDLKEERLIGRETLKALTREHEKANLEMKEITHLLRMQLNAQTKATP